MAARAGFWTLLYTLAFIGYLFLHPESELWHWLTMVLVPAGLVWWLDHRPGPIALLAAMGVRRAHARRGLGWALLFGVVITVVQLLNRNQRALLAAADERLWYLLPLAFVLMVGTAATTEEVLFRGVLQRRLEVWWRSPGAALLVSALLFGLYHFPYLYLNAGWRTQGDVPAALGTSLVLGLLGGVPLGLLFRISRGNLLAPILGHALFDLVPATAMLVRLLS